MIKAVQETTLNLRELVDFQLDLQSNLDIVAFISSNLRICGDNIKKQIIYREKQIKYLKNKSMKDIRYRIFDLLMDLSKTLEGYQSQLIQKFQQMQHSLNLLKQTKEKIIINFNKSIQHYYEVKDKLDLYNYQLNSLAKQQNHNGIINQQQNKNLILQRTINILKETDKSRRQVIDNEEKIVNESYSIQKTLRQLMRETDQIWLQIFNLKQIYYSPVFKNQTSGKKYQGSKNKLQCFLLSQQKKQKNQKKVNKQELNEWKFDSFKNQFEKQVNSIHNRINP